MRLRAQIAGTMVIVIVLPLAGLLYFYRFGLGLSVPAPFLQYLLLKREISSLIRTDGEGSLFLSREMDLPPGLELLIVDSRRRVVFSNIPDHPEGDPFVSEPGSRLFIPGRLADPGGEKVVVAETLLLEGRAVGEVFTILRVPHDSLWQSALFSTLVTWFLLFLVFMGIGVSFVVGRLGAAVLNLERAAEHIAAGDLDSAIRPEGPQEIASLSVTLDRMRRALKEESERRVRFLAAISHDLKTPLTSIEGYIEALEDELGDSHPESSRYVGIMKEKAASLEHRVRDLLDFARASTGEWRAKLQPRNLRDFLHRIARGFSADAGLLGMGFSSSLEIPPDLTVSMDEPLVVRVMENLLSNSLRYCPEGTTIALSARVCGPRIEVVVEDDGPGIPRTDLARIFEPYFRGGRPSRTEGSGLGLYIARSIVQSHGWELSAFSEEGRGSRFTITMPTAPSDVPPGTNGELGL